MLPKVLLWRFILMNMGWNQDRQLVSSIPIVELVCVVMLVFVEPARNQLHVLFQMTVRKMVAALMVFAIPIIIIFSIFNKQLMTNLTMGGMKE